MRILALTVNSIAIISAVLIWANFGVSEPEEWLIIAAMIIPPLLSSLALRRGDQSRATGEPTTMALAHTALRSKLKRMAKD